jgi:hypothetical protein
MLEGSLGRTRMETLIMVERLLDFFSKRRYKNMTRSWLLDWRGCFEQGIEWDAPPSLGMGLDFGLGLWKLYTTICLTGGSNSYIILAMHFQPISLKSQQSLAIQSHGLSTWTTIV